MPSGNIFVHNVGGEPFELHLNGAPAGTVQGWSRGALAAPLPVSRVLNASDGQGRFFNGRNQLSLNKPDGMFSAEVAIDGRSCPITQELHLLVTRNRWHLVSAYGDEIGSGELRSSWG